MFSRGPNFQKGGQISKEIWPGGDFWGGGVEISWDVGFGDPNGEFWLGLDKIHRLSKSGQNVLRVDIMDFNGARRYAKYGKFSVADESDKYRLNIGSYSGNCWG